MRHVRTVAALLALALILSALPAGAASVAVADRAAALAAIEEAVEERRKELGIPGISLAIVQGDEVIYNKGLGLRDVDKKLPVTPDTLFAIGSNTKSFTATLLAMQVDDGDLDWDEPVRTYLPEFQLHDQVATTQMTAVARRLTEQYPEANRDILPRLRVWKDVQFTDSETKAILYTMFASLRLYPDARYRKSATIVGDAMGKYHPHGDTAIYDAMVRMAQDFSLRDPLVVMLSVVPFVSDITEFAASSEAPRPHAAAISAAIRIAEARRRRLAVSSVRLSRVARNALMAPKTRERAL